MNDTIASEALAAAVGGAISSGVLYPLEVLKTRMQAEGDNQNDDETKINGDEIEYDTSNRNDVSATEVNREQGAEESSSQPKASSNSLAYAQNLYRSEGMGVFFDGMEVSAIQSAIEKAMYFFAYTALKRSYTFVAANRGTRDRNPKQLSAVASVLLGCLAEWIHLPITLPIDALTTAIQTSGGAKSKASNTKDLGRQKSDTVMALWMTLWKEKSFYKGIQAYWILCFKPALQYTLFEQAKAWILKLRSIRQGRKNQQASSQLSAAEAFLLGMFSRTVATLVVFPFVRAKVRMQSLGKGGTRTKASADSAPLHHPQTIWALLLDNYTQGGWKALYQGLGPELTRGVLSAALMMMVKERISGGVKKLLYHGGASSPS